MIFPQQTELDALGKKVSEGLTKSDLDTLIKLTDSKKKWQNDRDAEISGIIESIKEKKIELTRLIGKAYTVADLRTAAVHFELIKASGKKNITNTQQERLVVGTFQLADYGFTVEPQADGTVPSEYEWDFNNGPRGASWKQKFVQAIIAKGIDDCMTKITPDFKAWLEISHPDGRNPNKRIFKNKAAFYKAFGLKSNGTPSKSKKTA
ncbi:MAG: hypothetical protein Q8S26_15190 [Azonexus sp.]|nr:hypothetical protein [Azonexus sp.]